MDGLQRFRTLGTFSCNAAHIVTIVRPALHNIEILLCSIFTTSFLKNDSIIVICLGSWRKNVNGFDVHFRACVVTVCVGGDLVPHLTGTRQYSSNQYMN